MDTPSTREKTATGSSIQGDEEKVFLAGIPPEAEDEAKVLDHTITVPTSPTPPAQADDGNQASALAAQSPPRFADGFPDAPPPLPFSCWDHKLSICVFWFFILAEVCFIPESLYYGLTFGTTLNHGARKSALQLHLTP